MLNNLRNVLKKSNELLDIIIPVGPMDIQNIHKVVQYATNNIVDIGTVYIIPFRNITIPGAVLVSESLFPFNCFKISEYNQPKFNRSYRTPWYLQQLIKLYAWKIVPGIRENYLVLDADTYFLNPTKFLEDGKIYLDHAPNNHGNVYYYEQMQRLHPSLVQANQDITGICHHMVFNRECLQHLFQIVETHHQKEFWKAFLECTEFWHVSGASEYEIYFNFMLHYYRERVILRELKFQDVPELNEEEQKNNNFVSVHWWMRPKVERRSTLGRIHTKRKRR